MLKNFYLSALLIISLGIGTAYAAGNYNSSSSDSMNFKSAKNAIENENFTLAVGLLHTESISDASNPDVWNLLGFASRKLGNFDKSKAAYEKALSLDPNHKRALEYMGELYLTLANREAAMDLLKRLKTVCPEGCDELIALQKSYNEYIAN